MIITPTPIDYKLIATNVQDKTKAEVLFLKLNDSVSRIIAADSKMALAGSGGKTLGLDPIQKHLFKTVGKKAYDLDPFITMPPKAFMDSIKPDKDKLLYLHV